MVSTSFRNGSGCRGMLANETGDKSPKLFKGVMYGFTSEGYENEVSWGRPVFLFAHLAKHRHGNK